MNAHRGIIAIITTCTFLGRKDVMTDAFLPNVVNFNAKTPYSSKIALKKDYHSGNALDITQSVSFTALHVSSRYDNLVSGIAEISLGTSIGVLWSEYAILTTGCGPLNISDGLERFCYQAVITFAGLLLFTRITTGKNAETLCTDTCGYLEDLTLLQVRAAEILNALVVLGAFVALGAQAMNGADMDGLSGIDVDMCRAIHSIS